MNVAEAITLRGQTLLDEPMSKHTSWRVGGNADCYYIPADLDDLQHYLAELAPHTELTWVGLGSNLLVRDGGIRGVVVATLNALKTLRLTDDGSVYAEAGVTCAKLAKFCLKQGFTGGDFFAGIPGTVGGALAMNAGAFGSETWPHVEQVTMLTRGGELIARGADEFNVSYRRVSLLPDEWFAAATFRFAPKADAQESKIKQLLQQRNASQPIGLPSCGSVFKNPQGQHAAQLIEAAGLKGYCLGAACVSQKHANFIISNEHTQAAEIEALIAYVQQTVQQRSGFKLETEVRIVGEAL